MSADNAVKAASWMPASFDAASVMGWLGPLLTDSLLLLAPLFGAVAIAAIVGSVAQTGAIFTFHPLTPDFTRLNPVQGAKRFFTVRVVYDALRSLFKLLVLGAVLALVVKHEIPRLVALMTIDPVAHAKGMLGVIASLLAKLTLAMLVIAAIDLLYTRWEFGKKMRMSRRDMKDEHKQREGDPRVRSRLRQLRLELLKRTQALGKVPGADVVITNPTHLAVAIAYRHGDMAAPQVLCKGAGDLAMRMRKIAGKHAIPVVENRSLARALFFKVDAEEYVPETLYPQVARILVWVFAMRDARIGRGA